MPQSLLGPLTADSPLNGIPGYGAYAAEQVSRNHHFTQDTESWALFAQGTYDLTDCVARYRGCSLYRGRKGCNQRSETGR